MTRLFCALTFVLWASAASAQEATPLYRGSLVFAVAGHGADISTTAWCRAQNTCVEANPLLRWAQDDALKLGFTKMAFAGGTLALNDYIRRRGHRKVALWLNIGHGVAFTYIAVRNQRFAKPPGGH